ncbi:hypothetical protein C7974DRAFT_408180 [Boeremia exigua]|uniref:uncharacterized protein n=1 Tax=Boeremia exigua TaxID=749465 RepID=UPI001E8E66C6|nr:uncharacterized protein C7974DRAFT_408180 [Boeremia exigua]KAH6644507.1 hypothetical protein C7974DRAFT_408180 [Boeremia exigua]
MSSTNTTSSSNTMCQRTLDRILAGDCSPAHSTLTNYSDESEYHFTESEPMRIIVKDGVTFYIHAVFLSTSKYLIPHWNPEILDGKTLVLFHIDSILFRTYASFSTCEGNFSMPFLSSGSEAHDEAFWHHWCACYVLARELEDTRFCNFVFRAAIEKMARCNAQPECFGETIYKNSEKGSNHRCLVAMLALSTWSYRKLSKAVKYESEFKDDLRELANAVRRNRVGRRSVADTLRAVDKEYHEPE